VKFLAPVVHDDLATLRQIARTKKAHSYPMLGECIDDVEARYQRYIDARGNAWEIQEPLDMDDDLAAALRKHYYTKAADLKVINRIRDESSPDVCPMCGSLKPAQVDHVFPKDVFPEYSFFTRNLVPACDCNTIKGTTYKGENFGERILHPYYDRVMQERLAYIAFSDDLETPHIEISICLPLDNDPAVRFHVYEFVNKTRFLIWAGNKWAKIRRQPEDVFPLLTDMPGQLRYSDVENTITRHLRAKDAELGTPNNWESMVYYGILASNRVLQYVTERINGLRSGEILPD
jgi:hypothetical protein